VSSSLSFQEALAWHRARLPLTKEAWEKLEGEARKQAFTIAGVMQLQLVSDVWEALDRAILQGESLQVFMETIGPKLKQAWGKSVSNPAWRLETIFRTHVQQAYNAGRYAQATHPETLSVRPYWMFNAVKDGRTSEICRALDGTILPAEDPWWKTHYPALHFNCRASVVSLTEEQAWMRGVTRMAPTVVAAEGFGHLPTQPPPGPKASSYPAKLWDLYQRKGGRE